MTHHWSASSRRATRTPRAGSHHLPEEVIRHFHIAFDDFGSYDVLAVDCVARSFALSLSEQRPWDPNASLAERAAEQAQEEALLLADAMAVAPLPPILSYSLDEGPPKR